MPGKAVHRGSRFSTLEERFWPKVNKTNGCWEWLGFRNRDGYGYIVVGRATKRAHRVSWELAHGKAVPDGLVVCHACDNPSCVRPGHLFIGTQRDNRYDAMRKNRAVLCKPNHGEKHPFRKLTASGVRYIWETVQNRADILACAERFGVQESAVYNVVAGRSWRSITSELHPVTRQIVFRSAIAKAEGRT